MEIFLTILYTVFGAAAIFVVFFALVTIFADEIQEYRAYKARKAIAR